MTTAHLVSHPAIDRLSDRQRSLILVGMQTILGATAQILMKKGVDPNVHGLLNILMRIFTNLNLFMGMALYGMSAILLILALRRGQLSLLYPIIALTFVWVAILSVIIFHEDMSPMRIAGISTVVFGVGLLGLSGRSASSNSIQGASH